MRIFIGIKISQELQEKILEWRKSFEKKIPARWIHPENLHITLIPPWYEKNINKVQKILEESLLGVKSFKIQFLKITYGPTASRPRLIWLEPKKEPARPDPSRGAGGKYDNEFSNLVKVLESSFEEYKSKYPPQPHVIIARFKPQQFKEFPIKELDENFNWEEKVEKIQLIESRLLRGGAQYDTLAEVKLI